MKQIAILGSTGSIGLSTLDVVASFPDHFRVVGLAAGRNVERLAEQIAAVQPAIVSVATASDADRLAGLIAGKGLRQPEIVHGVDGACAVAGHPDVGFVMTAMVGAIGLKPTLTAIERGIEVGIANKEPLVAAGQLCTAAARRSGATLLPVDSEHNAIHQCLAGQRREDVERLLLTCSGGPFRQVSDLSSVTREQALQHPTWSMGPKITIDSATLMNKGLEVVEARWLFDIPAERIQIVIHPQSVIHSMVEYVDGSVLAQLGTPDMRVPIGYALGSPARLPLRVPHLRLTELGQLTFESPDVERFPCVRLAYDAIAAGGTTPAVLNASNESAVAAFLDNRIRFIQIPEVIQRTIEAHKQQSALELAEIVEADSWARDKASEIIATQLG